MEVFMAILNLATTIDYHALGWWSLPLGEGFGFNTNILETNIINLAVVIGVVVSFGGDALRSLLENRKQLILNNVVEAENRASDAKEKLDKAKAALDQAFLKANEIVKKGEESASMEKSLALTQFELDLNRLEESKDQNIQLQQQKAISEISQQVISLALTGVREKLERRLDKNFHSSVNNFNIVLLTKYKN